MLNSKGVCTYFQMIWVKQTTFKGSKKSAWYRVKGEEIVETFHRKELQKTNQKEFRVEKEIKRKGDKLYVTWKGFDSSFIRWIDKKDSINELIFSQTEIFRRDIEIWNRTKTDLKNAADVDLSKFAKKVDLANLKSNVDKLDID